MSKNIRVIGVKVRNLISILFSLVLVLVSLYSLAQNPEPVYQRYSIDDGLPSSMVYHIFQDSKGYIWFATSNGVSRFDGYKFMNFDVQSGLVDNDVFEIYEDYKHRIWFIPMSGKLCYYENNKIVHYRFNEKITEYTEYSRGPIKCSFYVDSLDYVYLSLKRVERFCISPEGIVKSVENPSGENNVMVKELDNKKILISSSINPNAKYLEFQAIGQTTRFLVKDLVGIENALHHHLFFIPSIDGSYYISIKDYLLKIRNGKIVKKKYVKEDAIWMSIDNDHNLWFASIGGGVHCYSNCEFDERIPRNFLVNYKVSSVLKDREGAYWFSTLHDGVFYCSDIDVISYTKKEGLADDRINAVEVNQHGVYIGYEFGYVDLLKKDEIIHFESPNIHILKPSVRRFFKDTLNNNRIWVSSIVNLNRFENSIRTDFTRSAGFANLYPKNVTKSKTNGYWVGMTTGLIKVEDDKVVYNSFDENEFASLIYDLIEDRNGIVWFCTVNGLWSYKDGVYKFFGSDNPLFAITSYSIIQNPLDSSLWIGTNGAGIVVKKNNEISQITIKDGLISNSINQLYYKGGIVWAATKQGLSKVTLLKEGFKINNFSTANGLPTNEVTSVAEYKGNVYVGTPKGLAVFPNSAVIESTYLPNVIISNFKANNNQFDPLVKNIELNYDQSSLSFDFVGFVFRNAGKVNYRYRMLGVDTTWVQTQTPNCLYNGLTDGDYKFEVNVQSYNGVWSKNPASISFSIHPPYWRQAWFLVLGAGLFSCFIFIVYKIRINDLNRRNSLLQNINLYKQQSLRQQMNPHFIFNTLNSIQLYILEKDPISSHKYLTKFARLMRMTLDNSLYPTIPLRDEIEALKLYLDLEKLRFEDRFEYSIEYGSADSILNFKIPTLLIQPFVENAIWHGISLKKDQIGWIKILLVDNDKSILCIIEDNGVGRKHASEVKQMKKKEHQSRGSQITQQRIDLLSSMYKERFNINYDDLADRQGASLGTRVTISIPKEV